MPLQVDEIEEVRRIVAEEIKKALPEEQPKIEEKPKPKKPIFENVMPD